MSDERNRLILTSQHVPKLRYRANAKTCKPLLHCIKSLKHDDIHKCCILISDKRHIVNHNFLFSSGAEI